MGRKKLNRFTNEKIFAARVEEQDFALFEDLIKKRDGFKTTQQFLNDVIVNYISGALYFSGSQFHTR